MKSIILLIHYTSEIWLWWYIVSVGGRHLCWCSTYSFSLKWFLTYPSLLAMFDQSITQLMDQSIDPLISQSAFHWSINFLIDWSPSQSINRLIHWLIDSLIRAAVVSFFGLLSSFCPFPWLCKERMQSNDQSQAAVVSFFCQFSSVCPFPQLCEERKRSDNWLQVTMVSFLADSPLFALFLDFVRKGSNWTIDCKHLWSSFWLTLLFLPFSLTLQGKEEIGW